MSLTEQLAVPLNALMMICYRMVGHYLAAILIFTLLTKVILFPVSLWTHRNGITMIRLMPELNRLKVKYYGDKDTIAEKTQALQMPPGARICRLRRRLWPTGLPEPAPAEAD